MGIEVLSYVFIGIIFIVSISVHEYAHVAMAYALGDPTGKLQGRLTPNPLKHIDPIGFVLIFLIGFGWGRPAPYNPAYFKSPYRDELLVALAGPASNILLGIGGLIFILIYSRIVGLDFMWNWQSDLVAVFWMQFVLTNFALAAFNMIPLPPLDGYRLIKVLNHRAGEWLEQHMQWISIIFLALVVFGPFQTMLHTYITTVSEWLFRLFMIPLGLLFF